MRFLIAPALAALATLCSTSAALAATPPDAKSVADAGDARLLALHTALAPRLSHNPFGRPLVLESLETSSRVSGDVYAEIDTPFETVRKSFANPRTWCEVMILHVNTKYCHTGAGADAGRMSVRLGKKGPQEISEAFGLEFAFHLDASRPEYLATLLTAPIGPVGTKDYRFQLQAVPLAGGKSFLRLHYSYSFGGIARLATQGYLATSGRDKVGFTRVTNGAGKSHYVDGMRGVAERNTMRYYLAVESYLGSLAVPPGRQFNSRAEHWFDATEKFRLQLHEMDRAEYLAMKQSEYARQQSVTASSR